MVYYKCKICGGQLEIGNSGSFCCQYCGAKSFMTDADFKGNEEFRKKLLSYAKAKAEEKEIDYSRDYLWNAKGTASFTMANSKPLNIQYMFRYEYANCECFVAKETVVYVFERAAEAGRFLEGLHSIAFPEADNKLTRCFPQLKMELELQHNKKALVFVRKPLFYPAELFAPWPSVHLAWVISRMENFCCALEYSGIQYGDISPQSVFVNPETHEGMLFGDWRKTEKKKQDADLKDLRKTAVMLAENTREPMELYHFLNGTPEPNAYDDFSKWDMVIERGFGGHKFVKM